MNNATPSRTHIEKKPALFIIGICVLGVVAALILPRLKSIKDSEDIEKKVEQRLMSEQEYEDALKASRGTTGLGCKRGGCSGQVCQNANEEDAITTCEWQSGYSCTKLADCVKGTDGECGWVDNDKSLKCGKIR